MLEKDINPAHGTFPIVGTIKGVPQFIGTGFFIDAYGGFVTAKHVLERNQVDAGTDYTIIQYIDQKTQIKRNVKLIYSHPTADIALGKPLDLRINGIVLENPIWNMAKSMPSISENISTVAYPNSTIIDVHKLIYNFRIDSFKGIIMDIHDRCPTCKLTTQCYQTNIVMKSGSSGGPVFNRHAEVIGINSVSFEFSDEDQDPLSFITPLHYIDDIIVDAYGKKVTFGELKKIQRV